MDVTRLLSRPLLMFCTMISGIQGSKTLPMDQPIFSTKSIYHGYSLLCASPSSKAILFSFIFLLWISLPLCLFEAHCYVEMLRVLQYTSSYFFLLLRQTGQILYSQQSAFSYIHIKSSTMRGNLPIYASNKKHNHLKQKWNLSALSAFSNKLGSLAFFIPLQVTEHLVTEYTCSAFTPQLWVGEK